MHTALDLGSNLLDTADVYGPFTNELLLGRVLRERRSEAFVSAKVDCGRVTSTWSPTGGPAICGGPATPPCGGCGPMS